MPVLSEWRRRGKGKEKGGREEEKKGAMQGEMEAMGERGVRGEGRGGLPASGKERIRTQHNFPWTFLNSASRPSSNLI